MPPLAPVERVEFCICCRSTIVTARQPEHESYRGSVVTLRSWGRRRSQNAHADAGTPAVNFVETQRVVAARLAFGFSWRRRHHGRHRQCCWCQHLASRWPQRFDVSDLDPATGMPLRVRYIGMIGFMPPFDPTQNMAIDPPERAEVTMTFADRRLIDGVQMPFRVTTTARSLSQDDKTFGKSFDRAGARQSTATRRIFLASNRMPAPFASMSGAWDR